MLARGLRKGSGVIADVVSSGALPTLETLMRFSGARHRIIAHNIANISTPNFVQKDVSVRDFQGMLGKAIEARRAETGGMMGPLNLESSEEVEVGDGGTLVLNPTTSTGGVMSHDRNNRSIERLMQDHAENAGVFRIASELMRSRMQFMRDVIAERV